MLLKLSVPVLILGLSTTYSIISSRRQEKIALDQKESDVVAEFIKEMKPLLLDRGLRNAPKGSEVIGVARGLALATLARLKSEDAPSKRTVVLRYLIDSGVTNSGGLFGFADSNLSGADLSGADMRGAILSRAELKGANLSKANLSGADLREANLSGADLGEANLSKAYLSGADLRGANLIRANLNGADLSESFLEVKGANLSGAKLIQANLGGANLKGASLMGSYLTDAFFRETICPDGVKTNTRCPAPSIWE